MKAKRATKKATKLRELHVALKEATRTFGLYSPERQDLVDRIAMLEGDTGNITLPAKLTPAMRRSVEAHEALHAAAHKPAGVTVSDLPDLTGTTRDSPDPELHCFECGTSYSANRGDYFSMPGRIFTCCGEPMSLVRRRVVFELVTGKSV